MKKLLPFIILTLAFNISAQVDNPAVKPTPKPSKQEKAAASIAAHRHSVDMKITVREGRKFILMGDLENARVQVFEVGSTFVIPANTWHME